MDLVEEFKKIYGLSEYVLGVYLYMGDVLHLKIECKVVTRRSIN